MRECEEEAGLDVSNAVQEILYIGNFLSEGEVVHVFLGKLSCTAAEVKVTLGLVCRTTGEAEYLVWKDAKNPSAGVRWATKNELDANKNLQGIPEHDNYLWLTSEEFHAKRSEQPPSMRFVAGIEIAFGVAPDNTKSSAQPKGTAPTNGTERLANLIEMLPHVDPKILKEAWRRRRCCSSVPFVEHSEVRPAVGT